MAESPDPKVDRAREWREFWNEFVVPTATDWMPFVWQVVLGWLVIYLVARLLCP